MKNVQTNEDLDVDEDELEDLVCLLNISPDLSVSKCPLLDQLVKAKEQQEKEYIENAKSKKSARSKVRHRGCVPC